MDISKVERLLQESIGVNVSSLGKNTLINAINRRIHSLNLGSESSYFNYIKSEKTEINELIEEVTVNETWFFRDKHPFTAIASFAKEWQRKTSPCRLRVLSLPCSTGEEPYSIAISLLEAGLDEHSFHIDAVDINSKVIKYAQAAVYNQNSFRGSDRYLIDKYFEQSGKHYLLKNKFKNTVKFYKGNLINFTPPNPGRQYNIVFCRNLLIYLDKNAKKKAVATLDRLLTSEGLLFVGHAEAGAFSDSFFTTSPYPKSFSFVRKSDTTEAPAIVPTLQDYDETIPGRKTSSSALNARKKEVFEVDEILEARYLLERKDYEQALSACEKYIEEHGPTSQAFFWLGAIYHKKGENNEAVQMLKKAIYLDPDNLEAMELLSTIFLELSDTDQKISMNERMQRVRNRLDRKKHL
jgi:chemotaxis protein methyltransferase WspC